MAKHHFMNSKTVHGFRHGTSILWSSVTITTHRLVMRTRGAKMH
jgi:hypothetical protein